MSKSSLTLLGCLLVWACGRVDGRLQLPEEAEKGKQVMEYAKHGVAFFHKVFTPEECEEIVRLFTESCKVDEVAVAAASMEGNLVATGLAERQGGEEDKPDRRQQSVDEGEQTGLDLREGFTDIQADAALGFRRRRLHLEGVEFNLLHEFKSGYFFDFHIDTKPNDGLFAELAAHSPNAGSTGTSRTININIMLSARDKYKGGELQVSCLLAARRW
eukprot:289146-Hanusia_phi.AAC.2